MPGEHLSSSTPDGGCDKDEWEFASLDNRSQTSGETVSVDDASDDGSLPSTTHASKTGGSILPASSSVNGSKFRHPNPGNSEHSSRRAAPDTQWDPRLTMPDASSFERRNATEAGSQGKEQHTGKQSAAEKKAPELPSETSSPLSSPGLGPCQDLGSPNERNTEPEGPSKALQPDPNQSKQEAPHTSSFSPGLAECSTEELWTESKVRLWARSASLREKFSTVTTTVYHISRPYLENFANFWRGEENFGRTSKPKSAQGATDTTESTEKIPHEADGETEPQAMSESPSVRADIGGSDQQGTSSQEHGNGPTACDKASSEVTVRSGAGQAG